MKVLIHDGILEKVVSGGNDDEGLGRDFDPVGALESEGLAPV